LAQSIKPPEIPDYFEPAQPQPPASEPAALPEGALPAPAETPGAATESIPAEAGGKLAEAQPTAQPTPASELSAISV